MEKEKQPTNDREGLVNVLQRARQVVLCAHVSPDGDTIGSCLALRLALQRLGKEAAVICQDKVPNMLSFLPGADSILRPEKLNVAHPELALCVDVSDQRRLGSCICVVEAARETAQIDHQGGRPWRGHGRISWAARPFWPGLWQ